MCFPRNYLKINLFWTKEDILNLQKKKEKALIKIDKNKRQNEGIQAKIMIK